ncbi:MULTISPECIES: ABC transporter permease subunit [Neobacillus]|uniref:ABC transporter permease subunit n=1 Tax=Neobacillus citreus TaxID=2833578 RepID=A0A942T8I5_9BACI|nr:ABC transporter permease subunit [Neobacillus citreus]MCH6266929.1 ABC transporter permease subunit [Neobacillus citreus]
MILFLLKRKRFVFGVLFLVTLLTWSIVNTVLHDGEIRQVRFFYDDKGNLIDAPPYPPFTVFLLGSDKFGYDLGQMMIEGAKYTIGITLIVAILRLLLSLVASSLIYSVRPRLFGFLKSLFEPFSVVPQTIIVYFILFSVLWMPIDGFQTPFWKRALFETVILIIIAIPNLTIHLANEMRIVEKEDFIVASKTLGASKRYIYFKHIVPHVYEKWILLFGQQFTQVLQLLAHLGFMKLFFGGTFVSYGMIVDDPRSVSYEWSGVIGGSLPYLYSSQWIIIVPVLFFIFTAISVAFINDSIKSYFQRKEYTFKREKV